MTGVDRATPDVTPDTVHLGIYPWYVAGILMLTYAVQHVDRQIVAICIEPLRREFGLNDSQLGLLSGLSFAIAYSIAVLPLGMLSDRTSRRNLLGVLMFVWSLLTGLASLAGSFGHLLAARVVVGAAESGANPAAISLLADYFGRARRSAAVGLYYLGQGIGIFGGFAIGGYVAATQGWRAAFLVAGLPGLILAVLLLLTVREPKRDMSVAAGEVGATMSFRQAAAWIVRSRSLVFIMLGGMLSSLVVAAFMVWIATFLIREHGFTTAQAGLAVGIGLGLSGSTGAAIGGFASDALNKRGFRYAPAFIAAMTLLMVPASLAALWVPSAVGAVVLGSIALAVAHAKDGPMFASIASLARPECRGRALSIMSLMTNLVGFGVGAQIVGVISDIYQPSMGASSLRYAMMTVMLLGIPAAVLCLGAVRFAEADLRRAEGETPHDA